MARRIVGVDSPTVQAQPNVPQNVALNTEAADTMWGRAAQNNQEGFAAQQRALQAQQAAISANTQALANRPVQSPLQGALDGVLQGIKVYGEISNQRAQAKAAKAEAERQQQEEVWARNAAEAYRELTPALMRSREIIHNTMDTEGVYSVQAELTNLIDRYDLAPEQREEIYKYIAEETGSYQQGQLTRLTETQKREEAALADGLVATFESSAIQYAAVLKSSTDPQASFEAASQLYQQAELVMQQLPESMSMEQRLGVWARITQYTAGVVGQNADGQAVVTEMARLQQQYNESAAAIQQQYADNPIVRDQLLASLKAQLGGEVTYDSTSQGELYQETVNNLSAVARIQELTAPTPEQVQVVNSEVGRWVWMDITGQDSIENLKTLPGGEALYETAKNARQVVGQRLEENETWSLQVEGITRQANEVQAQLSAIQQYASINQAIQAGTATPQQRQSYLTALQAGTFDPNTVEQKSQELRARYEGLSSERNQLLQRMQSNNDVLAQYGFGDGEEGFPGWYEQQQNSEERRAAFSQLTDQENQYGSNSNFATRDVLNAPAPRPLPKAGNVGAANTGGLNLAGISAPFSVDRVSSRDIHITAVIKDGSHADGDSLDFAVAGNPTNVGVVPMVSGTVVDVVNGCREGDWECGGGWGNRVLVRDAQGRLWNYAHLSNVGVKVGDTVAQGANYLGTMGNTGASEGVHLHLNVSQDEEGNGVPIAEWALNVPVEQDVRNANGSNLNGLGLAPRIQRRTGMARNNAVAASAPEGAVVLPNGTYYFEGRFYFANGENPSGTIPPSVPRQEVTDIYNPIRPTRASTRATDYRDPNNVDHNFGYAFIEENAPFRTKLNQVARNLGIPTQWLADTIATVTGGTFNTTANGRGVGLLMFDEESARVVGYDLQQISRMNATQQLDLVERYLSMNGELNGQYRTLENLWLAVWYGRENYDRDISDAVDDPSMREGLEWVSRIGNAAGRRYNSMYDIMTGGGHITHTTYHADCESCRAFYMADGGADTTGSVGRGGSLPEGATVANPSLKPEEAAILDGIAAHEATGYNIINGGSTFSDYSRHPDVMGADSYAAGRYQFMPDTWASYSGGLDFSPASQDTVALRLIREKRSASAIFDAVRNNDYDTFRRLVGGNGQTSDSGGNTNTLAAEWASVPVDESGRGYYPGQSGWGSIREMWEFVRERYAFYSRGSRSVTAHQH